MKVIKSFDTPREEVAGCEPTDVLGKFLALIEQIRPSPHSYASFIVYCIEERVESSGLKLWVQSL